MPIRPTLRPGAVLLRRDPDHLQIGVSPGLVLRDRPGLLSLLRTLDGTRAWGRVLTDCAETLPELDDAATTLRELLDAGVVLDATRWGSAHGGDLDRELLASWPGQGRPAARSRSRRVVALVHDAHTAGLASQVATLAVQSALSIDTTADADLTIVLSHGEPARDVFDAAVDQGHDHLRVVVEDSHVRVGPFVVPGLTPCVTCHDLHRSDWDPGWPALVPQFGRPGTAPLAPALAATTSWTAAVQVVDDVVRHVEGRRPRTVGHCVRIGPGADAREAWPLAFHPACLCALLSAA